MKKEEFYVIKVESAKGTYFIFNIREFRIEEYSCRFDI